MEIKPACSPAPASFPNSAACSAPSPRVGRDCSVADIRDRPTDPYPAAPPRLPIYIKQTFHPHFASRSSANASAERVAPGDRCGVALALGRTGPTVRRGVGCAGFTAGFTTGFTAGFTAGFTEDFAVPTRRVFASAAPPRRRICARGNTAQQNFTMDSKTMALVAAALRSPRMTTPGSAKSWRAIEGAASYGGRQPTSVTCVLWRKGRR